ncbi:pantothenate transporter liz1 [Bisporella sp. PMI_857]|nr:pantothenate transporter liz1 [Bisporella sp. PMI_857]
MVDTIVETKPTKKSFRSFIWDTDTYLKSKEEQRLLLKLDLSILTIGCLGFFLKYLDQGNLANAYISGMQEDLKMYGNEYTYAGTCYTVAYAVMQVPSTLIIQKVRPSYWLALMEIAWGTFTFAQAGTHNMAQLYSFRFLVGFFESSFFPCLLYVLGSWYTKTELAKRVALFHMTAPLGASFGGYLQAAVYKTLDGHHGLAGWRWLYIICGIMTVPVGLFTAAFFPDTPHTTRAFFLSEKERQMGIDRATKAGKAAPSTINLKMFKKVFTSWKWYAFVFGYVMYGSSCQAGDYFGIWLKSEGFSVTDRNVIPSCSKLISAFCIVMWGFGSDYTGSRIAFLLGPLTYGLIPNGILTVWPASVKLKQFAFMTTGVQLMTAIFYTWANEVCAGDNEERALVISSMNGMQYAVAAWLPIVIFPQVMAPTFRRGFPATFGFVIAAILIIISIQLKVLSERRKKGGDVEGGGEADPDAVDESGSETNEKRAGDIEVRDSKEIGKGAVDKEEKL